MLFARATMAIVIRQIAHCLYKLDVVRTSAFHRAFAPLRLCVEILLACANIAIVFRLRYSWLVKYSYRSQEDSSFEMCRLSTR
jgi:hypothetical protein